MLGSPDNGVPVLKTKNARLRSVGMPLFILAVVALLVYLLTTQASKSELVGSGSTLARPLIQQAAREYRNLSQADNPERRDQTGVDWVVDGSGGIDYQPVGSLGGIMRLADPEVDFAVADYPVSTQTLDEKKIAQFPIAVGAVAVVHNLDLPADQTLRLDAPTTAGIFSGRITTWSDPALARLNPGVSLPDLAIKPVHRQDGSGSTLGLTRYLSAGDKTWKAGPGSGTVVEWPAGRAADRSSGLISAVQAEPGSIGYVELGQALRANLKPIAMANDAGGFVRPGGAGMQAAVADADWSAAGRYAEPLALAPANSSYPLTVAIYAMVRTEPRYAGERDRALRFLRYIVDDYDGDAEDLGYLPLPEPGARAVKEHWRAAFGVDL